MMTSQTVTTRGEIALERGRVWSYRERASAHARVLEGLVWVTRVGGDDEIYGAGSRFALEPGVVVESLEGHAAISVRPGADARRGVQAAGDWRTA
jgi:hypothetical protein